MDIKEYNKKQLSGIRHPWEQARVKVIMNIIEPYLKDGLTIADIGCGDTYVLQSVGKKIEKAQLIAVDTAYTPEIIEELKQDNLLDQELNINYYNSVEDIKEKKIDLILLMDVIEHIEDDRSFLKKLLMSPYCTSKTKILITVPAFNFLFSLHDEWLGHYRRYTVKMIEKHLPSEARVERVGYLFFSLLLPRMVELMTQKMQKKTHLKKEGVSAWAGGRIITNIIKNSLVFDYIFWGKGLRMPGLSAYSLFSIDKG